MNIAEKIFLKAQWGAEPWNIFMRFNTLNHQPPFRFLLICVHSIYKKTKCRTKTVPRRTEERKSFSFMHCPFLHRFINLWTETKRNFLYWIRATVNNSNEFTYNTKVFKIRFKAIKNFELSSCTRSSHLFHHFFRITLQCTHQNYE